MPKGPRRPIPDWLLFDECDRAYIAAHNWHIDSSGYPATGALVNGRWTKVRLHRALLDPGPGLHVDHINGDKLDNRRANIRIATPSVNALNRPVSPKSKSGVKNVYFYPGTRRRRAFFAVQILVNGKKHIIGRFKSIESATAAITAWKQEYIPGIDFRGPVVKCARNPRFLEVAS